MSESSNSYTINGVKVMFPCKPYPSQFSMMDKIIRGIVSSRNCLLESPTGSGKSLALLCSTLAWQAEEQDKQQREMMEICCGADSKSVNNQTDFRGAQGTTADNGDGGATCESKINGSHDAANPPSVKDEKEADTVIDLTSDGEGGEGEDDDFKPCSKSLRSLLAADQKANGSATSHTWTVEKADTQDDSQAYAIDYEMKLNAMKDQETRASNPKRVAKIFFGTRTHKQVAQIVRELGRTAYGRRARMCILASREFACVHPRVSKQPNKNDACSDLRDPKTVGSCGYFHNAHRLKTQSQLQCHAGFDAQWDIEDLVRLGKKIKVCAYYATRGLKDEADIIFCPYNYLIDPVIRQSMEINLRGQIVVLDEAHNIEDAAREAASASITQEQLDGARTELEYVADAGVKPASHRELARVCSVISQWIGRQSDDLEQTDFATSSRVWTGVEMVAALKVMAIGPDEYAHVMSAFGDVIEKGESAEEAEQASVKPSVIMVMRSLLTVLQYIYKDNLKYMDDYRCVVQRTIARRGAAPDADGDGWLRARRGGAPARRGFTHSLNFWCLNPAVAFSDLSDVRCVVLTSGTLSPMSSFQSELGVPFPIQLEANHVIHRSQVWVGTLGQGPHGQTLNATYRSAETYAFQDELGQTLLQICLRVPHGVLCFLPSYNMLEKLRERWQTTTLWEALRRRKHVVCEPRSGDREDFAALLHEFYAVVAETAERGSDDGGDGGVDGALFIAVCRGKVSEGLDFADNNARAVVTVGIPYPGVKDPQVALKRSYNDQHRSRGLLSGANWYEIQAYRALNQALGRCIRHRGDWGALVLLDDRYTKNPTRYTSGLSKWLRHRVNTFHTCHQAFDSLETFIKEQQNREGAGGGGDALDVTVFGTPRNPGPVAAEGDSPPMSLDAPGYFAARQAGMAAATTTTRDPVARSEFFDFLHPGALPSPTPAFPAGGMRSLSASTAAVATLTPDARVATAARAPATASTAPCAAFVAAPAVTVATVTDGAAPRRAASLLAEISHRLGSLADSAATDGLAAGRSAVHGDGTPTTDTLFRPDSVFRAVASPAGAIAAPPGVIFDGRVGGAAITPESETASKPDSAGADGAAVAAATASARETSGSPDLFESESMEGPEDDRRTATPVLGFRPMSSRGAAVARTPLFRKNVAVLDGGKPTPVATATAVGPFKPALVFTATNAESSITSRSALATTATTAATSKSRSLLLTAATTADTARSVVTTPVPTAVVVMVTRRPGLAGRRRATLTPERGGHGGSDDEGAFVGVAARGPDIGCAARRRGLSRRLSASVCDNRRMDKRGADGRACSPVLDMRSVGDTVKQEPMAKPQPAASDRIILAERRETNPREETTSKRRRGSTDDEAITAANRGGGGEGEGTVDENDWEDGGRLVTRRSSRLRKRKSICKDGKVTRRESESAEMPPASEGGEATTQKPAVQGCCAYCSSILINNLPDSLSKKPLHLRVDATNTTDTATRTDTATIADAAARADEVSTVAIVNLHSFCPGSICFTEQTPRDAGVATVSLNAVWSEADACVFRPMACVACRAAIGLCVVAAMGSGVNPLGRLQRDEVVLLGVETLLGATRCPLKQQ